MGRLYAASSSPAGRGGLLCIQEICWPSPGSIVINHMSDATRMSGSILQRGGLWVLGQSVLLGAVIAGGILGRNQWQSLALTLCGAVLLLVSAGCGLAGTVSLGRNLTPFPKPSASTRLVQTGIYGLIRHPLYTAVFCGSVGWALVWRSWPWPRSLMPKPARKSAGCDSSSRSIPTTSSGCGGSCHGFIEATAKD